MLNSIYYENNRKEMVILLLSFSASRIVFCYNQSITLLSTPLKPQINKHGPDKSSTRGFKCEVIVLN